MKKLITTFKITHLMIFLFIFILSGAGYIITTNIDKYIVFEKSKDISLNLIELSDKLSATIHELQKERGMSAGFVGSKGQKFANMLPKQRVITDEKIIILEKYIKNVKNIPESVKNKLEKVTIRLNNINEIRNKISSLSVPVKTAVGWYTKTNALILNTINTEGELPRHKWRSFLLHR